jgi:NAD(P)-dependent dehydrogenase (short-subunit alcohol dehydrogenase family)
MSLFSLYERRVLVVGGSAGIGLAVARHASRLGAVTVIASRSAAKLDAATAELAGVAGHVLDAADTAAVRRFFAAADPFDHVVVTAAELDAAPLRGASIEDARAAMDSKFWSAVNVAREARIVAGGSLTFVSGVLSARPAAGAVLLGAINAALDALARGLALELAPVRVNCVSPGRIDTSWWDRLPAPQRAAMMERTAAGLPVKRVGMPDDIAMQVVACMANGYMTGSVVAVDGGASIA